jgi:hypothetical protein
VLPRNEILGVLEFESEQCLPLNEDTVASIISNIEQKFPKVPKKHFSSAETEQKANLNVPEELKQKYIDILFKHQADQYQQNGFRKRKQFYPQNPSERQQPGLS